MLSFGTRNVRKLALLATFAFVVPVMLSRPVSARDTTVGATLCNGVTGSAISITTPQNDSVLSAQEVTVEGAVSNATYIEVSVDGAYDTTYPLSIGDTTYSLTVSLGSGTHTIRLVANDRCQLQNDSAETVVTIQNQSESSNGDSTSTAVGGSPTGTTDERPGGVAIGLDQTPLPTQNSVSSLNNGILAPVGSVLKTLDLDGAGQGGSTGTALALATVVTITLLGLLFGSRTLVWLLRTIRLKKPAAAAEKYFKTHHVRRETILRLVSFGILLAALSFRA